MSQITFLPKNDQELAQEEADRKKAYEASRKPLVEGEVDFQVVSFKERISRKGDPMREVCLKVWDKNGTEGRIFDFLLFHTMIFKVKHFCSTIGKPEWYLNGKIVDEEVPGKLGRAIIKMGEERQGKDKNGNPVVYEAKMEIKDYIVSQIELNLNSNNSDSAPVSQEGEMEFTDDDIPF